MAPARLGSIKFNLVYSSGVICYINTQEDCNPKNNLTWKFSRLLHKEKCLKTIVFYLFIFFFFFFDNHRSGFIMAQLVKRQIKIFITHISRSVVFDSLRPHESQHARPPCPSPAPGVHSDSCPSSQWYHPAISFSVIPF